MNPGDKVRLVANPGRVGILGNETDGPDHRQRVLVHFLDGEEQFVLAASLERVERESLRPHDLVRRGRFGRASDLRGAITFYRLNGRLGNLIYSLNTTNTQFLPYQFKPVLQFLDSPSSGILIADEVGLGKTIEAGLIWTELRARQDARRLLVICPAMLREKWKRELSNRFGVQASIVDAGELLNQLEEAKVKPLEAFALIASLQGLRPSRGWNDKDDPSNTATAKLARFLEEAELDAPLMDLVIIDEAHYLRNAETQTNLLGRLVRPVTNNLVMLSATPVQLHSRDLFNLLHLLDENAFPFEFSFNNTIRANAPLVLLRDRVLNSTVSPADFLDAINEAMSARLFDDNQQLQHLRANLPSMEDLVSPDKRADIADQLDRINPLAKVITRTLKRDVQENRVERQPHVIKARMSPVEAAFYEAVTDRVREFCERLGISEGFMLTIPQRQLSSCMAAACRGWTQKTEEKELEEEAYELFGDVEEQALRPDMGTLIRELVDISKAVGDYEGLYENDSKYHALLDNLRRYWQKYPGKKVVLFSFYRNTLHYLAERMQKDGHPSVVVHGGMDKDLALRHFESETGPSILLSSEVASEGVDLQFSSLVINYDLPWNPARIEQRIGRVDRIGQEEAQILIWSFVYEDTIDDRIYSRLLERLDIFKQALGSMEAILGEEIRQLAYDLLSHKLSPEKEEERIDRTRVTLAKLNRDHARLEEEATQLIAHGEFIQNKVKAAHELGRYIRGEDLLVYARDFLVREYSGTRFLSIDGDERNVRLELSTQARVELSEFLQLHRLQGRTQLLSTVAPTLLFENKLGKPQGGVERVTQDHPLIRFVGERLRAGGSGMGYFPVSAIEVISNVDTVQSPGAYVYCVARWSVSGSREIERLEYVVRGLEQDKVALSGDDAELLVNTAALQGSDWLAAGASLDCVRAADLQESCRVELESRFQLFAAAQKREDADRIQLMVRSLEHHLQNKRRRSQELIAAHRASGNRRRLRLVAAEEGRLKKEAQRIESRIAELRLKETFRAQESMVSVGVIRIR